MKRTMAIGLSVLLFAARSFPQSQDPDTVKTRPPEGGKVESLGSFSTDSFTGRFSYSVKIAVPPARQGAQPQVALGYGSSAVNGWCGVGWGLGAGSIERDSRDGLPVLWSSVSNPLTQHSVALSQYDDSKGFVLSYGSVAGRLVNTGGDAYRPKIESSFLRLDYVRPHWVVTDRNGNRSFFGLTSNSRVENPSWTAALPGDRTARWLLSATEDVHGNRVDYTYDWDSNQPYLQQIDYGGNPSHGLPHTHLVSFQTVSRPDTIINVSLGFRIEMRRLLQRIDVFLSGQAVRSYRLAYETSPSTGKSRIKTIQQCSPQLDGQGNPLCLPPLTLTYQDIAFAFGDRELWGPLQLQSPSQQDVTNWCSITGERDENGQSPPPYSWFKKFVVTVSDLVDFDRDGFPDRVMRDLNEPLTKFFVQFGNGNGFDSQLYNFPLPGNFDWTGSGSLESLIGVFSVDGDYMAGQSALLDLDGDGDLDHLLRPEEDYGSNPYAYFQVRENSGMGFDPTVDQMAPFQNLGAQSLRRNSFHGVGEDNDQHGRTIVSLSDLDGDGKPDRVSMPLSPGPYDRFFVEKNISGQGSFGFLGQGGQSILREWQGVKRQSGTTIGADAMSWGGISSADVNGVFVLMMDINGDGLLDRVCRERYLDSYGDPDERDAIAVQLNNGMGYEPIEYWPIQRPPGTSSDLWMWPVGTNESSGLLHAVAMLVDINGDGLPDRVMRKASSPFDRFRVQINTGSGFLPIQDFTLGSVGDDTTDYWNAPTAKNSNSDTMVSLRDMDGDGLIDRVLRKKSAPFKDGLYVERNTGKIPDLLVQVENGIGGKTGVSYRNSTGFDNRDQDWTGTPWAQGAKSLLPFGISVVDTVSADNGMGEVVTTQYAFEHGMWDPVEREFRGFEKSTVIHPAGQKDVTFFHQGGGYADAAKGEHQDAGSHAKQGIPFRSEVWGSDDKLYKLSVSKVEEADLGNGRYFPFVSQTISMDYEGMNVYRATATQNQYNTATGDMTLQTNWGEVSNVDTASHNFTDIPGDTLYALSEYIAVTGNPSIVSRLSKSTVSPSVTGSPRLRETQNVYWDVTGQLKESKAWVNTNDSYLVTSFSYDTFGNLETQIDAAGTLTRITYDLAYRAFPVKVELDPAGLNFVTQASFETRTGEPLTIADAKGNVARYEYDEHFRFKASYSDFFDGSSTWDRRYFYSLGGIQNGLSWNYVHTQTNDAFDAQNGFEEIAYADGLGKPLQTRIESETAGQFRVKDMGYDAFGRANFEGRAYFGSGLGYTPFNTSQPGTVTSFDPLGRPSMVTLPAGDSGSPTAPASTQYGDPVNQDPWVTVNTDSLGKKVGHYRDAYGRNVKTVEVVLNPCCGYYTTRFEYDLLGRLTKVKDHELNETLTSFDSLGRKYEMTDPDMGHWTYSYDAAGRLYEQSDAKGNRIVNALYDAIGRLRTQEVYDENHALYETIRYTYDTSSEPANFRVYKGDLFMVEDREGWKKSGYDVRGRVVKSSRYLNKTGTSYLVKTSYDDADRVYELTYPGNIAKIRHGYDAAGHLVKVESVSGVAPTEVFYQAGGFTALNEPAGMTFGNGVVTTYNYYQNSRRLQQVVAQKGSSVHQNLSYSYDTAGQVLSISDGVNTSGSATASLSGIVYDDLHRLTDYTRNNTPFRFSYNKIGNVTKNEESGTGSYTYPTAGQPRPHAVTASNGTIYDYDANGQMKLRGTQTLAYDPHNRLTKVSENGVDVLFGYDSSGARLWREKGSQRTVWIGGLYEERGGKTLCHVMAAGKRICTFDPGPQHIVVPNPYPGGFFQYVSGDHLQSSNVITNRVGNVVQRYQYGVYGKDIHTQDPAGFQASTRFTDQVFDADTGLYYYGARYYDPQLARFIQPDTVVPNGGGSQALNRYAYSFNNPLNYTDPSGHYPQMSFSISFGQSGSGVSWGGGYGSEWVWTYNTKMISPAELDKQIEAAQKKPPITMEMDRILNGPPPKRGLVHMEILESLRDSAARAFGEEGGAVATGVTPGIGLAMDARAFGEATAKGAYIAAAVAGVSILVNVLTCDVAPNFGGRWTGDPIVRMSFPRYTRELAKLERTIVPGGTVTITRYIDDPVVGNAVDIDIVRPTKFFDKESARLLGEPQQIAITRSLSVGNKRYPSDIASVSMASTFGEMDKELGLILNDSQEAALNFIMYQYAVNAQRQMELIGIVRKFTK